MLGGIPAGFLYFQTFDQPFDACRESMRFRFLPEKSTEFVIVLLRNLGQPFQLFPLLLDGRFLAFQTMQSVSVEVGDGGEPLELGARSAAHSGPVDKVRNWIAKQRLSKHPGL